MQEEKLKVKEGMKQVYNFVDDDEFNDFDYNRGK